MASKRSTGEREILHSNFLLSSYARWLLGPRPAFEDSEASALANFKAPLRGRFLEAQSVTSYRYRLDTSRSEDRRRDSNALLRPEEDSELAVKCE